MGRIKIDPDICDGKPTIRGLTITVKEILDYVAAGLNLDSILAAYPALEMEDIYACFQYATLLDEHPFIDMERFQLPLN